MNRTYGIKISVFLLCLVLLCGLFAACDSGDVPSDTTGGGAVNTGGPSDTTGGGETPTGPSETVGGVTIPAGHVAVSLSDYALLVSEKADKNTSSAAAKLMIAARDELDAEFGSSGTDFVTNVGAIDPNAFEILVGPTNRSESTDALAALDGTLGYVIKKSGNKIVINASTTALLDDAVAYFVSTYMASGASGIFAVPETLLYVKNDMNGIAILDENGGLAYDILYSKGLDITSGADKYDRVDYVTLHINTLIFGDEKNGIKGLSKSLGIEGITADTDSTAPRDTNKEILLGATNRPETATFRETLAINEYGYGVVGNKLVITGWSDYTIGLALDMFAKDVDSYIVENDGVKSLVLLESDRKVMQLENWRVDVPLYNAGELSGVVEHYNDCYQAYYTETTEQEYRAYCADLVSKGYRAYQTNQIGANLYGTYTNDDAVIHVYYVDYLKAVRFFAQDAKNTILPQNEDPYKKVTNTSFTAFDFDTAKGNWGNCFIITLEDGSFILHDGGGTEGGTGDPEELYHLLDRLNAREDGRIVIAGWIISHQHYDHFMNAYTMLMNHKSDVDVEKLIFNVPTESIDYNTMNPNHYYQNGNFENVRTNFGTEFIMMRSGQTIQLRNLKVEVVYSADDAYPRGLAKFNNSAFVTRFDVGTGSEKQRFMILGDAEEVACEIMVAMHGDALKCDIVTVAHHGSGGSIELYARCKPKIVVWPGTQSRANGDLKVSNKGYYGMINKSLCNQPNVQLLVVADYGHRKFDLPLLGLTNNRASNEDNMENYITILKRRDGLAY